jgi:hypothetical protein
LSSSDFWSTNEGLYVRIEDLAESMTWQVINESLKVLGTQAGATEFEWITEVDERSCDYCDSQSGRRYKRGQFVPNIPVHPNCRCHWDVHFQELKTREERA